MAHMAKFKGASSVHIIGHCERERGKEGYLKYNNNSYINDELTPLNYSYSSGGRSRLNERLNQVAPSRRKDAVTMVDWVVTLPEALKDADEEQQRRFFDLTNEYLTNRYGQQNVVGSYVHFDETSPHLHFCLVPVVTDKKTGKEKLCCKELMTRTELNSFHKELDKTMEAEFGQKGFILTGITKEAGGNQSISTLKAKTIAEGVEKLKNALTPIQDEINAQIEDFRRSNKYYFLMQVINDRNSTKASDIFNERDTYYFRDIKIKRGGFLISNADLNNYFEILPTLKARDIIAEKTEEFVNAMDAYSDFEPLEKYKEIQQLHQLARHDRKKAAESRASYESLYKVQRELNNIYAALRKDFYALRQNNYDLTDRCDILSAENARLKEDLEYYKDILIKAQVRENYYISHYGSVSQTAAAEFMLEQEVQAAEQKLRDSSDIFDTIAETVDKDLQLAFGKSRDNLKNQAAYKKLTKKIDGPEL